MSQKALTQFQIHKVDESIIYQCNDQLASEEPMEIRLMYNRNDQKIQKSLSVTMRTPGNDFELAKGFLFTEGIIKCAEDIIGVQHYNGDENVVNVELRNDLTFETGKLERNFYTTSSCGICGKSSIEAIRTVCSFPVDHSNQPQINSAVLYSLPEILRSEQAVFENTGGLHASALFDVTGNLLLCMEDVGRHNAVDKLVGAALDQSLVPLTDSILLLSGRAGFELIQKAWMAGIKIVVAVGAPSSLAVQLARESGITLIGFLRGRRFNIYSGAQRIKVSVHENSY